MKLLFAVLGCLSLLTSSAQKPLVGFVLNSSGEPLSNASVRLQQHGQAIPVGDDGGFTLYRSLLPDTLIVTHIGYIPEKVALKITTNHLTVELEADPGMLQEVTVNTGYYNVPKERATGSFTHIDNESLNRSVGTNILDRLEGITNGMLFYRGNLSGEDVDGKPEIRIRGLSTIEADATPLIVVDNFPFEGDITDINPNDVESITILKDAAAASIWGARAGNGVIVITSKRGRYNQKTRVSFNSSVNLREKPDLFYSQHYLPAATVMEIQKELFERGTYIERDRTYLPGYVELLIKKRDGLIPEHEFLRAEQYMRETDLRQQSLDYLYQQSVSQQYALNVSGGGKMYNYAISTGLDRNKGARIGDASNRMNVTVRNGFKLSERLEISTALWYAKQAAFNNGMGFTKVASIYEALVNPDGAPRSIISSYRSLYQENAEDNGLLDWLERPLDEVRLADNRRKSQSFRFSGNVDLTLFEGLKMSAFYQYLTSGSGSQEYFDKDSYYVRNLVNKLTQDNGTRIIPYNGIMRYGAAFETRSQAGRLQVNYTKSLANLHEWNVLAGAEIGETLGRIVPGVTIYNFDSEIWTGSTNYDYTTRYPTRPSGSARIPAGVGEANRTLNRNLSYYGNGSYSFKQRYIISSSLRWDGSNLLGVKTNQRGTALWSTGLSWQIDQEDFYQWNQVPYLRIKTTYGTAGNIDKSQSHYPTIRLKNNGMTNLIEADLTSPGNPSLQWEQVNTLNVGIDFGLKNQRIKGGIEFYTKWSNHLLGANIMDPTTGIDGTANYKMNYGSLRTVGWDVQVMTRNVTGPFTWNSTILFNVSDNRITKLNRPLEGYAINYINGRIPEKGKSADILYALPWHGLDATNGLPVVYLEGQPSTETKDYETYVLGIPYDQLINAGLTVPPVFGSLRNMFSWKGFQLDFLIAYRFGHVFRRASIGPGQEYLSRPIFHMDYFKRWKTPGDEQHTDVPAATPTNDRDQSYYYLQSEALITSGDVIRLQDIRLQYDLSSTKIQQTLLRNLSVFCYAKNLGVLWKANRHGIDPDYPNADYPAPRSFALGIRASF